MAEQKELSGVLFKNDKRTDENKQPNARGTCLINGQTFEISAWTRADKNGAKFQSLAFKVRE